MNNKPHPGHDTLVKGLPNAPSAADDKHLLAIIEALVNEPQPLGIDRPAYQAALKVLPVTADEGAAAITNMLATGCIGTPRQTPLLALEELMRRCREEDHELEYADLLILREAHDAPQDQRTGDHLPGGVAS